MPIWIDQNTTLNAQIAGWPTHQAIGLDTEFMRTNTFVPHLALVQANVADAIALLDAPALGAMEPLAAYLSDANTVTIMHSASEDLEALASALPNGPSQLFDTQIAAALAGLGAGLSYQKLTLQLLDIEIAKTETRSDWLKRPLSDEQLEYAAQDVLHLPALHQKLGERLDVLGRSTWLAEDCQRMLDRFKQNEIDPEPQRAFRTAANWPLEAQARLRKLLLWREAAARAYDRPKSWLLEDNLIISLAEQPPGSFEELKSRSQQQRALRQAPREALWREISTPLSVQELDIRPIPAPLNGVQKRAISAMKAAVSSVAADLQLPEGLLCPRRQLENLVSQQTWPSALSGWREPLLYSKLMALVP